MIFHKILLIGFLAFVIQITSVFAQPIDQIIAVVGNEIIKKTDIENQALQMERMESISSVNVCTLFEEMLLQKLLINQALIDSIEVSDSDVDGEISRRIAMFTASKDGLEKFEKIYGKTELEIRADWKPIVKNQILAQKAQQAIVGNVEISPNEVKKYVSAMNLDTLPQVPVTYEISQIVLKPKITPEDYSAAKLKLEEVRQRAVNGENFIKLAVLYSDDTESAKQGGLLGDFITRAEVVPEFAAAAFRLKNGEISKVVKTAFGFHIIQMVELQGEKAKLRHILIRPKVTMQLMKDLNERADSVFNKLKASTITFEQAVKTYSDDDKTKFNSGKVINPYTGTSKFEVEMIEPSLLFMIRKLQVGQFSEPIISYDETGSQVYKILRLDAINMAHAVNVKDDYQMLKDMSLNIKKNDVLSKWVAKKQQSTYISLPASEYTNCDFKYGSWGKSKK